MARANKKRSLIEFKGTTLPVVSVTLHSLQPAALTKAATELFGDDAFFDGDAAVLELDAIEDGDADWAALRALFGTHGLTVIGVRGGPETLRTSAATAGLPSFAAFKRAARASEDAVPPAPVHAEPVQAPPVQAEPAPTPAPPPPIVKTVSVPTLVIDRPLRSGQQAYARGGDLVVLAAVNAGAEVIADGSIHIYAPLRGRALAGASGSTEARIFTTRFEPELVSIAGVYRTFEAGVPERLAGRPTQIRLAGGAEGASSLVIEALSTD
ncbi:septum site-determining protein MinC [Propionivibrio dicarboxylicus]|uniref:Probable septum site-determining protein MinC n=1 Tax=Propionivibrio dicarboxylicus TaxID=83767 RepID=A0A1G8N4V1_9RHOO|nr:septum site-determining protein MinC [Propionivibrio dicarboxylicus]SDI75309.1 septum site-determining protein MinC [Propionivibrio dicarboxylicus]